MPFEIGMKGPMPSQYPPATLPDTEVRLLESSIVNDTYRLHISQPTTHANSERTYPVAYLTDGNGLFPLVRGIAEGLSGGLEIPRLIIVGIGYDTDDAREWGRYRERDLLPTDASATDANRRQEFTRTGIRRGQAGPFLRFIREELKPFINANFRTNPEDNTFIGNSYGGLFGLYVLFHYPDTFNRYIIGSPAIHHDNRVALSYESDYAERHDDLPVRIFMAVGAREEMDDHLIDPSFQFVTNVKELTRRLQERRYPRLRLTTQVLEDETHFSVIPATFSRGLRAVFPISVWERGGEATRGGL
jgi:predicted alpha/beta superfamily hydrolase